MSGTSRSLTVELSPSQLKLLQVLGDPVAILAELVDHVVQGVERPGAWERQWLCQALGYDWLERLEQDPDCAWHVRPKKA